MSNLHCPNCGHLIGSVTVDAAPDDALVQWLNDADWTGPRPSGELYREFTEWAAEHAPDAALSHKAWGQSMARAGLRSRRGAQGVRVWVR